MQTVLLWALIALVPFSTIRVVCVTAHENGAESAQAADDSAEAECARICTHRPAVDAPVPPPEPAMKCLLTVDPSCELLAMQVFVLPVPAAVPAAGGVSVVDEPPVLASASVERRLPAPPPKSLG
jgi:hypothetical protein